MLEIRFAEGSSQSPGRKAVTARNQRGNMMVLALAITIGLLIAIGLFVFNYTRILGGHEQHSTAIEASSLAAAQAIARVVVEDPNYGFISLSDYPPIGQGTKAGDGEPLPVIGINTIVGTARLDMIVAHELGDETMKALAVKDVENTRAAARRLTDVIKASLQPGGSPLAKDLDGKPVAPYETAHNLYEGNKVSDAMGGSGVSGSFKLTLGYLDGGSTTLTPLPQPEEFAEVQADQKEDNNYKAFINIPAKGQDFTLPDWEAPAAWSPPRASARMTPHAYRLLSKPKPITLSRSLPATGPRPEQYITSLAHNREA
jgi:hypothetical protein